MNKLQTLILFALKICCEKISFYSGVYPSCASSGIGAGTAIAFAKLGANLVLGGRNQEQLLETKNVCIKAGLKDKQISLINGDVINDDVLCEFINSAINNFGQIDVVINNAGWGNRYPIEELKIENYDEVQNVNLRAVVNLTLKAMPHLIKTKGCIVNVSSAVSTRPMGDSLPYCVSKAGLDMFTKCLAFELAPKGVRVNSVNPGGVPTNIGRNCRTPVEQVQHGKVVENMHPIGRLGTVEEIADAIAFLASENSSFTTGQCLGVCGGLSLGGVKF